MSVFAHSATQAVYQSILHLSRVENLLTATRSLFQKQYAADLHRLRPVDVDCSEFDQVFDSLVRKLDTGSARRQSEADSDAAPTELTPPSSSASASEEVLEDGNDLPSIPQLPHFRKPTTSARPKQDTVIDDTTSADVTPVPTPDTSRPGTPLHAPSHLLTAKTGPGKASRRARKANAANFSNSAPVSSGDESPARRPKSGKSSVKQKRRWDADGFAADGDEDTQLRERHSVADFEGKRLG